MRTCPSLRFELPDSSKQQVAIINTEGDHGARKFFIGLRDKPAMGWHLTPIDEAIPKLEKTHGTRISELVVSHAMRLAITSGRSELAYA